MTDQSLYEFHPACLCMPKMDEDEFLALRVAIRNGYDSRHPILLSDGKILDGRHRYLACQAEGINPEFVEWHGEDPFRFVWSEHSARRSWNSQEQKVLVGMRAIKLSTKWLGEKARVMNQASLARSEAAKERPRNEAGIFEKTYEPVEDHVDPRLDSTDRDWVAAEASRTSTAIAKDLGVAPAAVKRATTIKNHAPEFAEKIMAGEMKAGSAMKEIKKNIANIKRQDRVDRITEISAGNVEMGTSEQFPVIYAGYPLKPRQSVRSKV